MAQTIGQLIDIFTAATDARLAALEQALVIQPPPPTTVTGFPFIVNPPIPPTASVPLNSEGFYDLAGRQDRVLLNKSLNGTRRGLNSENNLPSTRISTDHFSALNVVEYGCYLGQPIDHLHDHMVLSQAVGANQAMIRIGGGDRVIFDHLVADSSNGQNDTFRVYGCAHVALIDSILTGGILNLGLPPANALPGTTYPLNNIEVYVIGGSFIYKPGINGRPTYPAGINVRTHVAKAVIQNIHSTGGGRFLDSDGPTPIQIIGCTFNGLAVTLADCGGDKSGISIT